MNLLKSLLAASAPSFVSSEPRSFPGGSGSALTISANPFATPAFDRLIGLAVLAVALGVPPLPFLGR